MFYDINKALCTEYVGLNPLELLDYPAEDVFELITNMIDYNNRNDKEINAGKSKNNNKIIRRPAGDNWL